MNPFTSIPAFAKLGVLIKKYLKYIPDFKKLRESGDVEAEKALIQKASGEWAEALSEKLKISYDIMGEENIPESGPIMVYSNHQSLVDIAAILYLFRDHFQMGFIAKEEWRKVKPLAEGIEYTRSIFLIRDNPKEAVRAILQACDLLNQGFSLTIFPEGTRSRSSIMGVFKPGAFKFAQKAGVPILPVTLDGGYRIWEETGSYHPSTVKIRVHPLVHVEQMNRSDQQKAFKQIEETIRSGIDYTAW